MNQMFKRLTGGLTALCLLAGSALAAEITPSSTAITLEPGQNTISFEISLSADEAFAGAEFGIRPSHSDVKFKSMELLEDVKNESAVQTEKNGVYYFGFFSGSNKYQPGDYRVARLNYTYGGSADRTISLDSSKIVTIDETTNTTVGDTSTPAFTISVVRSSGSGGDTGGGGGGTAPIVPQNPDVSVTERVEKADGTVVETTTDRDGTRTVVETRPDGSVHTEIVRKDGSRSETTTDSNGRTQAEVKLPGSAAENTGRPDGAVELPLPRLPVEADKPVRVRVDMTGSAVILLPVQPAHSGIVAVEVGQDGSRTLLRKSVVMPEGVFVAVTGPVTLELIRNDKPFDDTGSHWARDAVAFVSARELFQGTGDRQFSPDAPMTRAMMATVLWRLEDEPAPAAGIPFTDVAADTWYSQAVAWAAGEQIINGFGDESFGPDRLITREQLAAMLYRYARTLGMDLSARGELSAFADRNRIGEWAAEPMSWAVGSGLIGGRDGGILDPAGNATRAEVAAILQRMVTRMVR